MSAGTLTLTNNSATVTGSGTAFTTELTVGDFIVVTVGSIPYTLAIKTVNSNTSLTLVNNYTGPTQGGAAWYAVPRVAMNLVTAALVSQSAEALRGLNYDKQNWQRLFSASGNITVTLPDGSSFTGPSWQYMVNSVATKTNGAVPITQGGTGATNADGARNNIGAAGSGVNSDIKRMTAIEAPLTTSLGAPAGGLVSQKTTNTSSSSFACKPFVARFGTGSYTLNAAFGGYMHSSGQATNSGALISVSDDGTFGSYWYFIQGGSVIQTSNGTITPAVSDIRVKNEKKVISEEEAVSFIQDWESILYTLKWSPDKVRAGFRAQDILARNEELIERQELNDGEGGIIEDGMIVDVAEVASAYLVPVVRQLLRRVAELEGKLRAF
ncbi:tail fiber domain-containing protein [Enterobacter hormaechei]|uniref:tail fiber domain-containing protein n=1 Tax=Enterobacter hormaechei TaxID=158836 RepID=UPI0021AD9957|nr:tail fiber domain-containing protein [Enterobacter hormaechei]